MADARDPQPITFAVPGTAGLPQAVRRGGAGDEAAPLLPGTVKTSVRVAARRDAAAPVLVTAVPGEDIVAVHVEDGPVLLLHPATARDLMLGPAGPTRAAAAGDAVPVPVQLPWPGAHEPDPATRDLASLRDAVVSTFQVLTGLGGDKAARFVASQVVQRVDGQVEPGVYALQADRLVPLKSAGSPLAQVPPPSSAAQALLVLLHGTFVDTESTFSKLWDKPALVQQLFQTYGNRVYALDHPTLGASPVANALTLVKALPDGARLHLVSHSRGGLVAEVLARVCGSLGVSDDDLAWFADPEWQGVQQELRGLGDLVRRKGVRVDRVVRVACPARGTLLASTRLDAYVSVLKWTMELAGLKLLPAFVDFAGEVARRRARPQELPGLASMIPGSPVVEWLNSSPAGPGTVPGELRVVAGDLQRGTTVLSWVKALLADAYYWTDNDIVVHTRSMYGGTPRAGGASFLLDRGSEVTHFTYFSNDRTASAVVQALVRDDLPEGFKPIGLLSWKGEDAGGERGALLRAKAAPDPDKPAVFVLPGILGSNLQQDDERIWLSPRLLGSFDRLAYLPDGADHVRDDGPVGRVYDKLVDHLSATHEVIPFGYDWRRPLRDEARRLADAVKQAIALRRATRKPVHLVAHSMGGLLARTMQLVDPDTWSAVLAHPDARLLMLGTPNGGSWAPMLCLSGDDTFGNVLAAIGSPLSRTRARNLMAAFPGFLQLQAGLLDESMGLARADTWRQIAERDEALERQASWWQRFADALSGAAIEWGLPAQAVLDQAVALRRDLDAQLDGVLRAHPGKVLLVVGRAPQTPVGFDWTDEGLTYRFVLDDAGDGRVPLDSALLPGVPTWRLDCEHGSLPSAEHAFPAFVELLLRGDTQRLPTLAEGQRGRAAAAPLPVVRARPRREQAERPASGIGSAFGLDGSPAEEAVRVVPPLQLSLLNADLVFVQQPLMLGHYVSMRLTGTEAVIDRLLKGSLSMALSAGSYAEQTGSHRIFHNAGSQPDNPLALPRPEAAIVVGLGEEGTLTLAALEESVCQGVKAWSQRVAEMKPGRREGIEIAATLLGSGGLGITPGAAARAIAQGVRRANGRLVCTQWPLVNRLTLVELYLDRAGEAWRGLKILQDVRPQDFELLPTVSSGAGAMRRQPDGYRGAGYDLVSVKASDDGVISFELDSRRARSEIRAQSTQSALVKELVARAAQAGRSDPNLGRALFSLLVPLDLAPFLGGTERIVLQLDGGTAPIPWELLDSSGVLPAEGGEREQPWAIRTRLLRKLSTARYRERPRDARADDAVLVIGNPLIDDPAYPDLPAARREADEVERLLRLRLDERPDGGVRALTDQPECDRVITELFARPYRIVHVAGHGEGPQYEDKFGQRRLRSRGGVVLSRGVYLGPDEIAKLPVVPELVFVNCCHLGATEKERLLRSSDAEVRAQAGGAIGAAAFAAGVAETLIEIGVRCVVAAGWAVDDRPAQVFATTFYAALTSGRPFIEAVHAARIRSRESAPTSKTWAAYQCYGDPDWVFRTATGDPQHSAGIETAREPSIISAMGLALELENLATRHKSSPGRDDAERRRLADEARRRLEAMERDHAPAWGAMGAVAEAFGVAWAELGDNDRAVGWYERAAAANDGSASLRTLGELANLRVRRAQRLAEGLKPGSAAFRQAHADLVDQVDALQALARMQPTVERLSLCGSAWKRLWQVEARAAHRAQADAALAHALASYEAAERLAADHADPQLFYPALNRMALELVVHAGAMPVDRAADNARARRSLLARHEADPDFWSAADLVNFEVYEAVAARHLSDDVEGLIHKYGELYRRIQTANSWASVRDQLDFVLPPATARAMAAERGAVDRLLAVMRRFAP